MTKKLTTCEFIEKSNNIHKYKYDYSKSYYINNKNKIEIICPIHGSFFQVAMHHLKGSGCSRCDDESRRKSITNFILEARLLYGDIYDYDQSVYLTCKDEIKINCKKHGIFYQTPFNHLRGTGCSFCLKDKITYSKDEFVNLANIEHNFKFNYEKVVYSSSKIPVLIGCFTHDFWFLQIPAIHLSGHGCPKCGEDLKKTSLEEFIQRSNIIHNNSYDYSLVEYRNTYSKVVIKCKQHNVMFIQTPFSHLQGHGCFKCAKVFPKLENEWLDRIGVPENKRRIILKINNKIYKTDAYDECSNTIYEFYGDYWHGNPNSFLEDDINPSNKTKYGDLYKSTLYREKELKQAGYNVISIWEYDYKHMYL